MVSGQGNQTCQMVTKVSKQVPWERAGVNYLAFQDLTITLFCVLPMETSLGTGVKQGNRLHFVMSHQQSSVRFLYRIWYLSCSGDSRVIQIDQTIKKHKLLSFLNSLKMVITCQILSKYLCWLRRSDYSAFVLSLTIKSEMSTIIFLGYE